MKMNQLKSKSSFTKEVPQNKAFLRKKSEEPKGGVREKSRNGHKDIDISLIDQKLVELR